MKRKSEQNFEKTIGWPPQNIKFAGVGFGAYKRPTFELGYKHLIEWIDCYCCVYLQGNNLFI